MVKFTVMNDLSARARQMEEMLLSPGPAKGIELVATVGPWLVTPDGLASFCVSTPNGNVYDLRMTTFHNGKDDYSVLAEMKKVRR